MKALCADVDKVETRSRWCPLQKAGSAGGVQPPHPLQWPGCFQPACLGWMGRTGVKTPQKIMVGVLGLKGGRRDCLGDKGKLRINSQSISLGGSLLKVPCKILAASYFAWKYGKSFVRIFSYLQCNYSGF